MPNPKDLFAKYATKLHETIFTVSDGKLLGRAGGMPVLMLHAVGRNSGAERTTMLTSPLQEGDAVVIVASYGGDDRHPAWFRNLQANPDVEITMGGERRAVHARVAEGEERTRLWDALATKHGNYAGYQRRTDREIPVVVLEPR